MARDSAHVFVVDDEGVRTVAVSGTLDVFCAGVLPSRALAGLPSDASQLVVDLSGLEFVDSGGMSALTRLRDQARARALDFQATLGANSVLSPTALRVLGRTLPCGDIYLTERSPVSSTGTRAAAER